MRRNNSGLLLPPDKSGSKSQKKHAFSKVLGQDTRIKSAPRRLEVVHQGVVADKELVFAVKVYSALETPGSELMTVSCIDSSGKKPLEVEMRFDEKFATSIKFKKQTDDERIAYAKEQIDRRGGFEKLFELFRGEFPKFGV